MAASANSFATTLLCLPKPNHTAEIVKSDADRVSSQALPHSGPRRTRNSLRASSFLQFPRLPLELQLLVWNYAATIPRRVAITYDDKKAKHRISVNVDRRDPNGQARVPAILHVCRQSRMVGLKSYELAFSFMLRGNSIYMNFDIDIIQISNQDTLEPFYGKIFDFRPKLGSPLLQFEAQIKHLVFCGSSRGSPLFWLRYLVQLESLVLAEEHETASEWVRERVRDSVSNSLYKQWKIHATNSTRSNAELFALEFIPRSLLDTLDHRGGKK